MATTNKVFKVKNGLELGGISDTISKTATDVFVYDTTKDSDGGAWRNRTQHTSWYNEASSSTRGSRKDFPARAIIVAETSTLTIYDADDPDLSMWMVFQASSGKPIYSGGITSVVAMNGQIWVGTGASNGALSEIHLIKDYLQLRITTTAAYNYRTVLNRNASGSDTITGETQGLVSRNIKSLAITVLPNATVDHVTGLPIPTIAVGTASGLSVILETGRVVDVTHSSSTYIGADHVSFVGNRVCYSSQQSGGSGNYWRRAFTPIPSDDRSGSYLHNVADVTVYDARGTSANTGVVLNQHSNLSNSTNNIKAAVSDKAVGFTDQVTLLKIDEFPSGTNSETGSRVAYISK